MNKGNGKTASDDYNTSKSCYKLIKEFVPEGTTLYDPFFNDGNCKKYMEEVFNCEVIHEKKDAFSWFPEGINMIITNPPFSIKYDVLKWLMEKDLPFACLLPLQTMVTLKFSNVPNSDKIQYVTGSTRLKFEKKGVKGSANFDSAWFCYKMNLPRDILIKRIEK